jgi:hypothetical protein
MVLVGVPGVVGVTQPAFGQADRTIGKTRPQNPEPVKERAPGHRSDPTKSGPPEVYSGVSGPGQPVDGTGRGGYRSGREGVMYRGPDPKPGWLPFGDRARGTAVSAGLLPSLRPIWDLHLRDTSICTGPDGKYYMTGSTGDNIWDLNDGVELYRSDDLQHWEYLGLVWSVDKDGTWERKLRYVWAPEIHIVKKNFVITYCMVNGEGAGTGILVSKTGKPEGPYINPVKADKPLTGGIDGSIFEDDDGKVYFTNGAGGTLHLMKDDLSAFDGEPIKVTVDTKDTKGPSRLGHEGVSLFKANASITWAPPTPTRAATPASAASPTASAAPTTSCTNRSPATRAATTSKTIRATGGAPISATTTNPPGARSRAS